MVTVAKSEPWEKLWDKIRNPSCTLCPLHEEAQTVCLIGVGPVPCDYMLIGEAPGYREDEIYFKPFAGDAGIMLDGILQEVGLNRDIFFISNVVHCRPPGNRDPEPSELKVCVSTYLKAEMAFVKPKYVILMGRSAIKGVLNKSKITEIRGQEFRVGEITYLPMFHTAYALRNPAQRKYIVEDFKHFKIMAGLTTSTVETKPVLVKTPKALQRLVDKLMTSREVAWDLETLGLDPFLPDKPIWCISLSDEPGIGYVVPLEHPSYLGMDGAFQILAPLLESRGSPIKIAHNGKFDIKWMMRRGVQARVEFDSLQAAHLLDENRRHDLKTLAQSYLGVKYWGSGGDLENPPPPNKLIPYSAKDADYDRGLYLKQREELKEDIRTRRIFQFISAPAVNVLAQAEFLGIPVDIDRLEERTVQAEEMVGIKIIKGKHKGGYETKGKLVLDLERLSGREINWDSPQQVADVLFSPKSEGGLDLSVTSVTEGGAPSTAEGSLVEIKDDHKIVRVLLDYRQWAKWKSTYLYSWGNRVSREHPFIHTSYKIEGTVTGRLSSEKPNMQQVPRDVFIRGIIGGLPGWTMVEADFSQIEVRGTAMASGDKTLGRIYRTGQDVHLYTASRVTGQPMESIDEETRKKAKAVVFGFIYGMGAFKFKSYAKEKFDITVTLDEAEDFRNVFFNLYSDLPEWHDNQRRMVNSLGYVRSCLGRKRSLPGIYSSDQKIRAEAERMAINSPIQSFASDSTVLAMNILGGELKHILPNYPILDPAEARICGTVHDSILFLIRDDKVLDWLPTIKWVMENLPYKKLFGWSPTVPIEADIKYGPHWGGAQKWKAA